MSTWKCSGCGLINTNKRWMCQACFTQNIHSKSKRNSKELLIFGYTRQYNDNVPIEITFICKQYFGPFIHSNILKINEKMLLLNYLDNEIGIENVYDLSWNLLFRATEHGFNLNEFCKHCGNKRNTVVIVYNKMEQQVFGGYTPCLLWKSNEWTSEKAENDEFARWQVEYEKDDTLTTCLFILRTKSHVGPQLFGLKNDKCHQAMSYHYFSQRVAFSFGDGDFCWLDPDLVCAEPDLMQPSSLNRGISCFQYNDTQQKVLFESKRLYLCGETDCIQPSEIEVFQLK